MSEAAVLPKKKFRGCTWALLLLAGRVSLGNVGCGMKAGFLWESCTEEPVEKLQLSTKARTSAGMLFLPLKQDFFCASACLPASQVGIIQDFSNWACEGIVPSPAAQLYPCYSPCASWTPTLHLQRSMGWEVPGGRWSGERHSFHRLQIPKKKP